MNIFTSKQLEEIIGLKVNTLHYYVAAGGLDPDVDPGEGRGKSRLFSPTNFVEALLIMRLILFGIPKKRILEFLKSIRKSGERDRLSPDRIEGAPKARIFLVFRLQTNMPATSLDPDPEKIHQFVTGGVDSVISRWYGSLVINLSVLLAEYEFILFRHQRM